MVEKNPNDGKSVPILSILDVCPYDHEQIAFSPLIFQYLEENCDYVDRLLIWAFFRDELWLSYVGMNRAAVIGSLITLEDIMKRYIGGENKWIIIPKKGWKETKKPDDLSFKECLNFLKINHKISKEQFKRGIYLNSLRNMAVHTSYSRAAELGLFKDDEEDVNDKIKIELNNAMIGVFIYSLGILKELTHKKIQAMGSPKENNSFLEFFINEEKQAREKMVSVFDKMAERDPMYKDVSFKVKKYFLTKP